MPNRDVRLYVVVPNLVELILSKNNHAKIVTIFVVVVVVVVNVVVLPGYAGGGWR